MSLVDDIKALQANLIPDNTNNEISPKDVRDSLDLILDNLQGLGSNYYGTIIPSSSAITGIKEGGTVLPEEDGVYANFSNLEKFRELCIFVYNGAFWEKKIIDNTLALLYYMEVARADADRSEYLNINLFNKDSIVVGNSILSSGSDLIGIGRVSGRKMSQFIPIIESLDYTLSFGDTQSGSAAMTNVNIAFFDADFKLIAGQVVSSASKTGTTVNAIAGAAYCAFNIKTGSDEMFDIKFEQNSNATTLTDYLIGTHIKDKLIGVTIKKDRAETSRYDLKVSRLKQTGVNMVNVDSSIFGLRRNPSGDIEVNANYIMTDYIPVNENTLYFISFTLVSLSGAMANTNLTFFDSDLNKVGSVQGTVFVDSDFTTPANAKYLSFNTKTSSDEMVNVKIEIGGVKSPYTEYLKGFDIPTNGMTAYVDGNNLYLRTEWDEVDDLIQQTEIQSDFGNTVFNFDREYLQPKTIAEYAQVVGSKRIKDSADDIAPMGWFDPRPEFFERTLSGGNHGFDGYFVATKVGHGLTTANLGDFLTDIGGVKYYIVNVIDSDKLGFLSENTGVSELLFRHSQPTGDITGLSLTITTSEWVSEQLYPATKLKSIQVLKNGIEDIKNIEGVHACDYIEVIDRHYIVNPTVVLNYLITNKVEWENAVLNSDANYTEQSISYKFTPDSTCVVNYDLFFLSDQGQGRFGLISTMPLTNETYSNTFIYIPKTVPLVHETIPYDFTTITPWDTDLASWLRMTSAMWEAGKMPSRMVEWLGSSASNRNVGLTTGFALVADGRYSERINNTGQGWILNNARKSYTRVFDNDYPGIMQNDNFQTVYFRHFYKPDLTKNYINKNQFENAGALYVNADYQDYIGVDFIEIGSEHLGKTITILDKSSNIDIVGNLVSSDGVRINKSDSNYSYIELSIE